MARLSNRRLPIRRAETMHGVHTYTYLALVGLLPDQGAPAPPRS